MFTQLSRLFLMVFLNLLILSNAVAQLSPLSVNGATTITTEQAKKLYNNGALFVDTRKDLDWEFGRIPDAIHLNLTTDLSKTNLLNNANKDDPIVLYCNGEKCLRSSIATQQLVNWGFSKVFYYRDGYPGWFLAGYPIE